MTSIPIGIDLGTSYSVISYAQGKQIKCVQNHATKNNTFPSVVFIPPDGSNIYVSNEATVRGQAHPLNYIYCVKRIMGAQELGPKDVVNYTILPPGVDGNDTNSLVISLPSNDEQSYQYTPVDISSFILNYLRGYSEMVLNQGITDPTKTVSCGRAVITVPAAFTSEQRRLTRLAARTAGMECLRILSEPTAAALAYLYNNFHDETLKQQINLDPLNPLNLLIFDLGGGTFDISVVSVAAGGFLVRATSGNNYFGGADIDVAIAKDLSAQYAKEAKAKGFSSHQSQLFYDEEELKAMSAINWTAKQLKENDKRKRLLREQAIKIKETLSNADSYTFEVFAADWNTAIDFKVVYTAKRLSALVAKMYDKYCEPIVQDALQKAALQKDDIYRCVLVGGSTRIPAIAQALRKSFSGVEPARDINPDEAVAKGAAYLATYLAQKQSTREQHGKYATIQVDAMNFAQVSLNSGELSAFQYCLGLKGQSMSCVVPSGSSLPAIGDHTFIIQHDINSPDFDINEPIIAYVYEQESHNNLEYTAPADKDPLFSIYISKQRIQNQQVSFYFKLDRDGVLDVYYSEDGIKYAPIHNLDDDESINALQQYKERLYEQQQAINNNASSGSTHAAQLQHHQQQQQARYGGVVPPPPPPHATADGMNKTKLCNVPPPPPRLPTWTRVQHKQVIPTSQPPDLLPRPQAVFATKIVETHAPFTEIFMTRFNRNTVNKRVEVLFPQEVKH